MKSFTYRESDAILHGIPIYRKGEHSFEFLMKDDAELIAVAGKMGTTSLSIGTLQVEIGIESRNLLYVWGYHPRFNWRTAVIPIPKVIPGVVTLKSDVNLELGVSLSLEEGGLWQTFYDANSEYVAITRNEDFLSGIPIQIADGCIVVLKAGVLSSLLLHLKLE